jgi:hypothetical protein
MADQITPPLILEKPAKPQKYAHREVLGRGALRVIMKAQYNRPLAARTSGSS